MKALSGKNLGIASLLFLATTSFQAAHADDNLIGQYDKKFTELAAQGKYDEISREVQRHPELKTLKDEYGRNILNYATLKNGQEFDTKYALTLLDAGVSPDTMGHTTANDPLFRDMVDFEPKFAKTSDPHAVALKMIEKGVDFRTAPKNGFPIAADMLNKIEPRFGATQKSTEFATSALKLMIDRDKRVLFDVCDGCLPDYSFWARSFSVPEAYGVLLYALQKHPELSKEKIFAINSKTFETATVTPLEFFLNWADKEDFIKKSTDPEVLKNKAALIELLKKIDQASNGKKQALNQSAIKTCMAGAPELRRALPSNLFCESGDDVAVSAAADRRAKELQEVSPAGATVPVRSSSAALAI